jgi:hypothetical protein
MRLRPEQGVALGSMVTTRGECSKGPQAGPRVDNSNRLGGQLFRRGGWIAANFLNSSGFPRSCKRRSRSVHFGEFSRTASSKLFEGSGAQENVGWSAAPASQCPLVQDDANDHISDTRKFAETKGTLGDKCKISRVSSPRPAGWPSRSRAFRLICPEFGNRAMVEI